LPGSAIFFLFFFCQEEAAGKVLKKV